MHVVIVGCGRVGSQLAQSLAEEGHHVAIIDKDKTAFERLPKGFAGASVHGMALDREVLRAADIENADALAAVTNWDNTNLVLATVAREVFHVPIVVARIYDPARAEVYRRLGVLTISPTTWGAHKIHDLILHHDLDSVYVAGSGAVEMVAVALPPHLAGQRAGAFTVPGEIALCVIERAGRAFLPLGGTEVKAGDRLLFAVTRGTKDKLKEMLLL